MNYFAFHELDFDLTSKENLIKMKLLEINKMIPIIETKK